MTTMTPPRPPVTGGVDTHRDLHVAAAVDPVGGVLATASFPTTRTGYRQLLAWLQSFGPVSAVGVEGTGSYGAALARHLTENGVRVIEVSRPNRQVRRRHGKTDVVDAIAAARAVLSGEASATPKTHDGPVEALRTLKVAHRGAVKSKTQAMNQLRAVLLTAPDDLRARLRDLPRAQLLRTCAAFRIADDDDSVSAMTRLTLRELARRVVFLQTQVKTLVLRMHRISSAVAPELVAMKGVGPDTASTLLVTAGDNPHRLRSERSFASLAGTSPVAANSGQIQHRYRLNRGGDRQANAALWRIVVVRMTSDQNTRDYLARRQAQGKTKSEAIRCLKRYVARQVFNALPRTALGGQ